MEHLRAIFFYIHYKNSQHLYFIMQQKPEFHTKDNKS